jgi:hypothetical protein
MINKEAECLKWKLYIKIANKSNSAFVSYFLFFA